MDEWLVAQFPVFGLPFQNWMVVAIAIVVVSALFGWLTYR
jgi:hypothetical protein